MRWWPIDLAAMRVSVVIPCHNSLEYLPQTLESVFNQDLSPGVVADLEIVLVDDGGTDDLEAWLSTQPYPRNGVRRVKLVRQENAGVSAARNFGVRESSGNLIGFCDSDDLWTPVTATLLAQEFIAQPEIGMAYGWYDVIDADGEPTGRVIKSTAEGDVWEDFVLDNPVAASGSMVSRRCFDDVGGFVENRDRFPIDVEDWELWIRIAATCRVGMVPQVVVHYRRHESNSSTDIESLELAYRHLIDAIFADAKAERAKLRPRAEARYKMILAWQSLNDRHDHEAAGRYLSDALADLPELRRSPEYWRVRTATAVLGRTGERGYRLMRSLNGGLRRSRT